jgi:protein-disulfide isomerase
LVISVAARACLPIDAVTFLSEPVRRLLPFLIIPFVLLLAIVGGAWLYDVKQQQMVAAAAANAAKAASLIKLGADPPHVRGSATAPVTLEEFGDFQCKPCGDLSPIVEKLEQDYGDRLRVIFRQFPLTMHRFAFKAACASEAAGLQGRFWEMHDLLYHNRFIWPQGPDVGNAFTGYAKSLGLDVERFKADMNGEQVKSRIAADELRGKSLGVDRTPVLFINNRQVPVTSFNPPGLHAVIDAALERKGELAKDRK